MADGGNRDVYFNKYILNTTSPDEYLNQLRLSPYRTHNRMAIALHAQFELLKQERDDDSKQDMDSGDTDND